MIPMIASVALRTTPGGRTFFIPVPLFLAWVLLLPVFLLVLPLAIGLFLAVRINPFRAIQAGWSLLAGLRGTNVQVDSPASFVHVRIL